MGVSRTGQAEFLLYDYLHLADADALGAGCHAVLPAPEYVVPSRDHGAEPLARQYEKLPSRYFPLSMAADAPVAIATHRFGGGRCVSFLGTFGAAYWRQGFPDYQILLSQVPADPRQAVVHVENAPSTLEVAHRFQPATGQHIIHIHLLHHTGAMERPRRRIISCADVWVVLHGVCAERACALRLSRELATEKEESTLRVRLSQLDEYEVVVFS